MDFFKEKIVKKKRNIADFMTIFIAVFAAILLIWVVTVQGAFGVPSFMITLIPIEIAAIVYGAYKLISTTSVEYEYSVTNDTLDIDKIVSRKKRSKVVSVSVKSFEYLAPFTVEHEKAYFDNTIAKRIDASSNTDVDACFAIYYNNSEKVCLLFEPTDEMLKNFERFVPRSLNHTI